MPDWQNDEYARRAFDSDEIVALDTALGRISSRCEDGGVVVNAARQIIAQRGDKQPARGNRRHFRNTVVRSPPRPLRLSNDYRYCPITVAFRAGSGHFSGWPTCRELNVICPNRIELGTSGPLGLTVMYTLAWVPCQRVTWRFILC
jgi:hypothetical protein